MDPTLVPYGGLGKNGAGVEAKYKECMRNHAAGIGGHSFDGCGEFMALGEGRTMEALKCAACGCHRNFHRKEGFYHHQLQLLLWERARFAAPIRARPCFSSETTPTQTQENFLVEKERGVMKKRYRTKFTQEQKERMHAYAETVGWKIRSHSDGELQDFLKDVGIKRHVLKVWMHNNRSNGVAKTKEGETQQQQQETIEV